MFIERDHSNPAMDVTLLVFKVLVFSYSIALFRSAYEFATILENLLKAISSRPTIFTSSYYLKESVNASSYILLDIV